MYSTKKHSKKLNIIAVAALFIASLIVWIAMSGVFSSAEASENKVAIVQNENGILCELSLSENTTFNATSELGTNVVVVEDGKIYIADADCPGHDCISQGKISESSQTIVCLPHKLWIEIKSVNDGITNSEEMNFDAIGS